VKSEKNKKINEDFKKRLQKLTDTELVDFINKGKSISGDEIFLAKKEYRIRQEIKNIDNKQVTFNKRKINKKQILLWQIGKYKSLIFFFLIVISIIFLTHKLFESDNIINVNYSEFSETAIGIAYKIENKTTWNQTLTGSKEMVLNYTIYYSFNVDKAIFYGSMIIDNRVGNMEYLKFIKNNLNKKVLVIRYKRKNISDNIIDLRAIKRKYDFSN